MEILIPLMLQILKMFLLMAVGYVLYKKKYFNDEVVKQLGNFLLMIVIPSVLVTSFLRDFNLQEFQYLGITTILSILSIGIGIVYINMVYKKEQILEKFACIFSNASFIGIPIISAMFGEDKLFFLSAYVAVFIILVWTYGIYLMTGDKKEVSIKKVITNPNIIAIIVGLLIYCTPIQLPTILSNVFKDIGMMNTPLSMMVLGTYLAKDSLSKLFTNAKYYVIAFNRLIAIPLLTILLLSVVPNEYMTLKLIVLVVNSVPSANTLAILAQRFDYDYTSAAHMISVTTIACIVTIPVITMIAQFVW